MARSSARRLGTHEETGPTRHPNEASSTTIMDLVGKKRHGRGPLANAFWWFWSIFLLPGDRCLGSTQPHVGCLVLMSLRSSLVVIVDFVPPNIIVNGVLCEGELDANATSEVGTSLPPKNTLKATYLVWSKSSQGNTECTSENFPGTQRC